MRRDHQQIWLWGLGYVVSRNANCWPSLTTKHTKGGVEQSRQRTRISQVGKGEAEQKKAMDRKRITERRK